jgi:hypothetical protein
MLEMHENCLMSAIDRINGRVTVNNCANRM